MSTKTIRVEVTQEDIDEGEPGHADSCPIAIAIRRAAFPGRIDESYVEVDGYYAVMFDSETDYDDAALPVECLRFVSTFDAHGEVKPFAFDLTLEDV